MPNIERVEVFQGVDKRWYFHKVARNNRRTAHSQSYRWKRNAIRTARKTFPNIPIVDLEKST